MSSKELQCPHCGTAIGTVTIKELADSDEVAEESLAAEVIDWHRVHDVRNPYGTDADRADHIEQEVKADIKIGDKTRRFVFSYAPDPDPTRWSHNVSATTDAGQKKKNAYPSEAGLYMKGKGVPWENEQTSSEFLPRDVLEHRRRLAGFGTITDEDNIEPVHGSQGRTAFVLDENPAPFLDEGEFNEDLAVKLAVGLWVLMSNENPVVT